MTLLPHPHFEPTPGLNKLLLKAFAMHNYVTWLRDSSPYINAHRDRTFVVMLPGDGTLVTQEQFEQLREATIEDVGGLIDLITPLEEQGILVRRSREVLEREVEQFSIVERDGLIIACAALYPIADSDAGELACLAVNPEYRHGGRGDELLERIEARARALGLKTLFVLTTRTAHWFRERGFEPSGVERLPAARASLYNFQRNSKIFEKAL